jgi:hypothetical protein
MLLKYVLDAIKKKLEFRDSLIDFGIRDHFLRDIFKYFSLCSCRKIATCSKKEKLFPLVILSQAGRSSNL